jgi:hypothetical protein
MIRVHFSLDFLKSFFLAGQIPKSIGHCTGLKELGLAGNQLEGILSHPKTLLPENLHSKILHTRTFTGTESPKRILNQQLPNCSIIVDDQHDSRDYGDRNYDSSDDGSVLTSDY